MKKKKFTYTQKAELFSERYGTHGVRKDTTNPTPTEAARVCHAVLYGIQLAAGKNTIR